jgi:hypothetical protein
MIEFVEPHPSYRPIRPVYHPTDLWDVRRLRIADYSGAGRAPLLAGLIQACHPEVKDVVHLSYEPSRYIHPHPFADAEISKRGVSIATFPVRQVRPSDFMPDIDFVSLTVAFDSFPVRNARSFTIISVNDPYDMACMAKQGSQYPQPFEELLKRELRITYMELENILPSLLNWIHIARNKKDPHVRHGVFDTLCEGYHSSILQRQSILHRL